MLARIIAAAIAAAATGAGCGSDAEPQAKKDATAKPRVVSSISSGASLSGAVEWTATPAGASDADPVDTVEFLIDGKVRWTETEAPYRFNDGVLHPWLLPPGQHSMAVRARTTDGRTASASAKADVQPRVAVPGALVGTFTREVSDRDIRRTADARGSEEGPPTGTWTMHVDRRGLVRFDDPEGSGGAEAVTVADGTMTFYGAPDWILPEDRQGGFCEPTGPAPYEWTASKGSVELRGGHDPRCPDRDAIFAGTWTRKR